MIRAAKGALLVAIPLLAGCRVSLSPLQNRIAVGQEAFVVFVADGEGGLGDLFAVPGAGGVVTPVTYTRLDESAPALAPDGAALAFLRTIPGAPDQRLVVMNLLNGSERDAPIPAGRGTRVAWSRTGESLFLETDSGRYRMDAPPGPGEIVPLGPAEAAAAESALAVLLGEPPFARVARCGDTPGLCVVTAEGATGPLAAEGRDPARWGGDSVAYFVADRLEIRPLGPGQARHLSWSRPPPSPRQPTVHPGPRPQR